MRIPMKRALAVVSFLAAVFLVRLATTSEMAGDTCP